VHRGQTGERRTVLNTTLVQALAHLVLEIAGALAPGFDTIICTSAHHKGGDPAVLADAMRGSNPDARVETTATIEQAFGLSQTLAGSLSRRIYVAGGLFTAIEFAAVARGLDAKQLSFF